MVCVRVQGLRDNLTRAWSRRYSNKMAATAIRAALLLVVLALPGCSRSDVWPMLTGEPKRSDRASSMPETSQTADVSTTPLPPSTGGYPSGGFASTTASTGTFVGQQVQQLRGDLQRLQAQVADHQGQLQSVRDDALQNGQRYYTNLAAINARLQIGTTPGNPNLVQQYNDAQSNLDRIGDDIGRLNALANAVASDSALATYLLNTTRSAFRNRLSDSATFRCRHTSTVPTSPMIASATRRSLQNVLWLWRHPPQVFTSPRRY